MPVVVEPVDKLPEKPSAGGFKQDDEGNQKWRHQIYMNITDINANGEVTVGYSEKLQNLTYWEEKDFNLTYINKIKHKLMNVTYYNMWEEGEFDETFKPEMIDWSITELKNFYMTLKLDLTNPLYISQGEIKDLVDVYMNLSLFWVATVDGVFMNDTYTLDNYTMPSQAKNEEEYKSIAEAGGSASASMLLTLVIPFVFMLFMSMSMDKVWSMYLMLQLASNLENFQNLVLPANASFVIKVEKNISTFKLF